MSEKKVEGSKMVNVNDWLILIPTQFERDIVRQILPSNFPAPLEICGFGPIVAAARTMQLIERFRPREILLLGIAGTYSDQLPVGQATEFSEVACYGVGVGGGKSFQTAGQMGWSHWPAATVDDSIGDQLRLDCSLPPSQESTLSPNQERLLLTVTAAADNSDAVHQRQQKFPLAMAEDMEGFAVAAACRLAHVPCRIVRGISNQAGDRNKPNWKIRESLAAAIGLVEGITSRQ